MILHCGPWTGLAGLFPSDWCSQCMPFNRKRPRHNALPVGRPTSSFCSVGVKQQANEISVSNQTFGWEFDLSVGSETRVPAVHYRMTTLSQSNILKLRVSRLYELQILCWYRCRKCFRGDDKLYMPYVLTDSFTVWLRLPSVPHFVRKIAVTVLNHCWFKRLQHVKKEAPGWRLGVFVKDVSVNCNFSGIFAEELSF